MNNVINFKEYFRNKCDLGELPGIEAQLPLAPRIDNVPIRGMVSSKHARKSSVLILLSCTGDDFKVVFTLRNSRLAHHGGQISFPGGKNENHETAEQAALREAWEEIGLDIGKVELLGKLNCLYVPPSNNEITPVVAHIDDLHEWSLQEEEVEEVFDLSLNDFIQKLDVIEETWTLQGEQVLVPFWDVHPKTKLWGATAMIFHELLTVYKQFLDET